MERRTFPGRAPCSKSASRPHAVRNLTCVLRKGRKSANIRAGLGITREIRAWISLHPLRRIPVCRNRSTHEGSVTMFKSLISTSFGAVAMLAVVAVPAIAQEIDAQLQVCSSCHGQNGVTTGPTIPIIWGQQSSYLFKQLHDYRSGDCVNPIMAGMVN